MDELQEAGMRAAEALDRALARRPTRDGEAFAQATEQLCRIRDAIIARERNGDRTHHGRVVVVNGVISSTLAGQFPSGTTPWPLVEQGAAALRELIAGL